MFLHPVTLLLVFGLLCGAPARAQSPAATPYGAPRDLGNQSEFSAAERAAPTGPVASPYGANPSPAPTAITEPADRDVPTGPRATPYGRDAASESAGEEGGAPDTSVAEKAQAEVLSEAEIAGMLAVVNDADIDGGKFARTRAKSAAVKRFADRMVSEHAASNAKLKRVTKKLNLTPQDSEASTLLRDSATKAMEPVKQLRGDAFDRSYLEHEVDVHQQVLEAIDKTLLPSVNTPDMRTLLQDARSLVVSHLEDAKRIQQRLAGKK